MDDPYAEIDRLRRHLKAIEKAAGIDPGPRIWTTAEIGDRDTYLANKDEIMAAWREGRITESEPEEPVRVMYPPTDIDRLTQVGLGMYVSEPLPPKTEGAR